MGYNCLVTISLEDFLSQIVIGIFKKAWLRISLLKILAQNYQELVRKSLA